MAAESPTWAYCRIAVGNVGQPESPTVTSRSPDLNAVTAVLVGETLDKWLDYLGVQGWELVGVLSNADKGHLLFRRLVE